MFSPNQHAVNGSVPAVRLPTYRSRHGPSAQSRCFPGRWRATTNCSSYAARIHVPSLTLMMRSARSSHSIASVTAAPNTRPAWQQRSPPTGHNGPRRPWKRPRREEVCTWIPIELFADEHKLILHARICILRCPQLRIAVSVEAIDVRMRFSGLLVLTTMGHFQGWQATVWPPWWSTHTLPLSTQPHSAYIAQFEWFGAVQDTTPWEDIYSPHCAQPNCFSGAGRS